MSVNYYVKQKRCASISLPQILVVSLVHLVLIEAKLGRERLHLACRHDIHEVVLSDICKICTGCSSRQEVGLFKEFRLNQPNIDKARAV